MRAYEVKQKVSIIVTLVKEYEYLDTNFSYYGTPKYIYTFKDDQDNTLVWKTAVVIGVDIERENSIVDFTPVYQGDKIQITATVKELSTYKNEPQVVLTRVKVKSIIEKALTKEEKIKIKRDEQIASLSDDDFLWEITYSRYKKHYADCETLAGSYRDKDSSSAMLRCPMIVVIIRAGRLKPSGTRGLHYSGYEFEDENGNYVCYRAICEENAEKRVQKDFPDRSWKCRKIYRY